MKRGMKGERRYDGARAILASRSKALLEERTRMGAPVPENRATRRALKKGGKK